MYSVSKKQSMLTPSKTTTRKAQGLLITSIGLYLRRSMFELRNLSLVSKFVKNGSEQNSTA